MDPQDTLLTTQVTVGVLSVGIMNWLKAQTWFPFMEAGKEKLNRISAALVAICSAAGIGWTYDSGTGTAVITGLTLAGIAGFLWSATQQYLIQQFSYRTVQGFQVIKAQPAAQAPVVNPIAGAGTPGPGVPKEPPTGDLLKAVDKKKPKKAKT